MDLELSGKRVLITGGTRGIGLACAVAFANEGALVTITGSKLSSVERAQEVLAKNCAGKIDALIAPLDQPGGPEALSNRLESTDILVNNAGAIPGGGLDTIDAQQWRKAWDLKVFGYIDATRKALAAMTTTPTRT